VRALVTGIAGFVGGHLVDLLSAEHPEVEIFGLVRPGWPVPPSLPERATLVEVELEDAAAVGAALGRIAPERIVHLAAQSSPQQSWADPEGTFRTNLFGLLHILEWLRPRRAAAPRLLVIGSAEEYGQVAPEDLPVRETAPLRPLTPYASSKVAQGFLALQYALATEVPAICTRTFHHTGPSRGPSFAEASFARQIAEIEAGQRPPVVEVGNLDAVRDFTDVRDVVRAYWLLLERGTPGQVYNVCSGVPLRVRTILETLIALARQPIEVRVDPKRLLHVDMPAVYGDASKLKAATGWEPRFGLEQTLGDLLEDVRARLACER
jgi:GDP-4-dehydro-6-deoxy-D-mannose reductase